MLRHVILIEVKPGTPAEATQRMVEGVRGLPSEIPQIRAWEVGLHVKSAGATVGIVALFDDQASFTEYQSSDAHHRCAQTYIAPILQGATQIQFEVTGDGLADAVAPTSPGEIEEQQ